MTLTPEQRAELENAKRIIESFAPKAPEPSPEPDTEATA